MTTILDWLKHPLMFGAPAWAVLAMALGVVAEGVLGRSSRPEFRSLAAIGANLLRVLLTFLRVPSIPIVGPAIVHALEVVAGVDLDGDGRIADKTPAPPAVLVILASLALGSVSCASWAPITDACEDCIDPAISAASSDLVPTGKAILSCATAAAVPAALPECVVSGLEALIRSLPKGLSVVDCMIDRIANGRGTTADPAVQATARAWLARRAGAGMKLRTSK